MAQRKVFMGSKDKLDEALANEDEPSRERNSKRGRGRGRTRRAKGDQVSRLAAKLSPEPSAKGESSSESRNSLSYDVIPTAQGMR